MIETMAIMQRSFMIVTPCSIGLPPVDAGGQVSLSNVRLAPLSPCGL
jgi:hypothetical protein